ncbi:uncharacterized protein DSM5745_09365 [Aspergillus mulundensis]|uniref:Putative Zn(II)2Cys6 transcription factor n=1 Tax=Aspergillus mulundensis TaxID=1810919 RepID=A0A3D8R0D3_9EURO|nr:putative Zn(II)2Cys6 transcription factor [Aspergillus mulundensis]RDW67499.1 putative Zn(II)2Cys6 transcription factor [Aspergillus mulundensis]
MPAQRRLRKAPIECAPCTEGQMECSKARPQCDECKSQRISCRYRDQKQSPYRPKPAAPFDSPLHSSPSPPSIHHRQSNASSTSSQSTQSSSSSGFKSDARADTPETCHVEEPRLGEMRLSDNWRSSTERTLTHSKSKDQSWQAIIQRESRGCPALHHSTLALSAMQLAIANEAGSAQRRDHFDDADRHYSQAVDQFPRMDESLSQSRSDAAFSTASILFMCTLASASLAEDGFRLSAHQRNNHGSLTPSASPSLEKLLNMFSCVRRLSSSTEMIEIVEKGELNGLFTRSDPYHQLPATYTLTILSMRNLNNATAKKDSSHETAVYDDAITKLDRSLEMLSKGGEPTMIALRWLFRLPSRYLELVREKRPLALIIFAHYCAVLHHLRDRWWMGDWGSRLVKEISQLLGPERLGSILWASDIVGIQT